MYPAQEGGCNTEKPIKQCINTGYQHLSPETYPYVSATFSEHNIDFDPMLAHNPSSCDEYLDYYTIHEDFRYSDYDLSSRREIDRETRRAEHNAIERARRENLNYKFQTLAKALPNLSSYRKPSKNQIVEKALDWVKQSTAREDEYRLQILQLQEENKRLQAQLNQQKYSKTKTSNLHETTGFSTSYFSNLLSGLDDEPGWSCDNPLIPSTPLMTPESSTEDLSLALIHDPVGLAGVLGQKEDKSVYETTRIEKSSEVNCEHSLDTAHSIDSLDQIPFKPQGCYCMKIQPTDSLHYPASSANSGLVNNLNYTVYSSNTIDNSLAEIRFSN